jgi:cell division protein FtsI/penicillin-binding protein 2
MTRKRVGILLLVFCLVVSAFGFKLYDMQIISTGGSTNNITTFKTLTRVKAARGNILDARGNVLVTNRASYDLVINHYVLTSSATPNETLLKLVNLCRQLLFMVPIAWLLSLGGRLEPVWLAVVISEAMSAVLATGLRRKMLRDFAREQN